MRVMCTLKTVLIIIGFSVLTSYSGQWEVFTNKNDVRDIALSGNTLWAATTGGVVAWNLDDNSYTSYTTLDGLISCNINHIAIDKKGRPWVATKNPTGLFVYENHAWEQMNVSGTDNTNRDKIILGMEVDRFGNVWIYTSNFGNEYHGNKYLERYDGQTWHKHVDVEGPLALDPQKNLLAVDSLFHTDSVDTDQFKIVSFNGSGFVSKWSSIIAHNFRNIILAHIEQDSKGNLWFSYWDERGGDTYGVVCNKTLYNTLDGLAHDNVRSITPDESGTVWCATDGGISKFTGVSWVTYDTTNGVASNLTYKILIDSNNTLYAATSKGISILKSNRFKTLKTVNEPLHNNYTDLVIDRRGSVVLAGSDHIAIYNYLQWKINYYPNIRVGDSYYCYFKSGCNNKSFIKSEDGTLYAIGNEIIGKEIRKGCILKQGTDGSTFFKVFSLTLEKKDNRYNRFVSPVVTNSSDESCFWLADDYGQLILINKQTAEIFPPSRFGIRGRAEITSMLLDRDGRSVWVGYRNSGIVHFDGDTVKNRMNVLNGFYPDWMAAIARDSSENLWFASGGGLWDTKQGGAISFLRNTKLTKYLKDSDGKEFGGCNALFVDNSGMVWTHADSGIARFNGSSWKLFKSAEVSPNLLYASYSHIIQDKTCTIWFGTEGESETDGCGLLAYKDNRWYQFTTCDGIPHNSIRSIALDSKNNLWILTYNGIAMRKSDETFHNRTQRNFLNTGNKHKMKQHGSRFYVSSKDKPKMIRCTLFDLRGRVVLRQTIHQRKSFVLPENDFNIGSGVRILSIITENTNGSRNKYLLKIGDIK